MVILLASCAGKKNKTSGPPVVKLNIDSSIHNPTATDILSFTLKPWTYFSSKVDLEFRQNDGKKINANGSIRMYKDSLIWISAGMFGIEGFRILINKDSVIILNKLEKKQSEFKCNLSVKNLSLKIWDTPSLLDNSIMSDMEYFSSIASKNLGLKSTKSKMNIWIKTP